MKLVDRFGRDGAFLFRWRSYLPLLLLGFAIPALFQTVQVE